MDGSVEMRGFIYTEISRIERIQSRSSDLWRFKKSLFIPKYHRIHTVIQKNLGNGKNRYLDINGMMHLYRSNIEQKSARKGKVDISE